MTPSEKFVFDLCRRSSLSLWTYANPQRTDGRELCDVLLVFGDRIVIFSVKEIAPNKQADPEVAAQRWVREAVDKSVAQLRGALRALTNMSRVIRHNGSDGVELPPLERRRIQLVAVAAGGKRSIPFAGGIKDGIGYVHVIDEEALHHVLGELDTTADFLHYLDAKEAFSGAIVCEGEENLLGLYLHGGRKLPSETDVLVADDTIWVGLQSKPEFLARKEEDRVSRWWDNLIETLVRDQMVDSERGSIPSEHERAVRTMAAEDRFARRLLSVACLDWLHRKEAGARSLTSLSGVGYVFGTFPRDLKREHRVTELHARCLVARSPTAMNCSTVVGLGTEIYDAAGYSFDVVHLHMPEWTTEDEEFAQEVRKRFSILQRPTVGRVSMDEFPGPTRQPSSSSERNRKKRLRRERR